MTCRHLLPSLMGALTPFAAGAAVAQARPALSLHSVEVALTQDLDRVLAPLAEGNPAAARRQLDGFLDGDVAVDLAPLACARALQLGLAGERDAAAAALERHFATHPGRSVAPPPAWLGQIYIDALREQVSQREVDGVRVQQLALRALALRQPPATVAAVVGAALDAPLAGTTADALRLAVTMRIREDASLTPPERSLALRALGGQQPLAEPKLAAPPLTLVLHTLGGKRLDLAALRDRVVLLHFWASWCPVSAAEAPLLAAAYARYHTLGLEVIGVAAEDDGAAAPVRAAAARLGLVWEHVLDGDALAGPLATRFGVETLPHAILIDRRGVLRLSGEVLRGEQLAPAVEKLLGERVSPRREGNRDQYRR